MPYHTFTNEQIEAAKASFRAEQQRIAKAQKMSADLLNPLVRERLLKTDSNGRDINATAQLEADRISTEAFLKLTTEQKSEYLRKRAEKARGKLDSHIARQFHRQ